MKCEYSVPPFRSVPQLFSVKAGTGACAEVGTLPLYREALLLAGEFAALVNLPQDLLQ
jgi:hypothetical protein